MFVRQKIDQLGEERSAGQVKDRNLGLILGGSIGRWEAQKRHGPRLDCLIRASVGCWSDKVKQEGREAVVLLQSGDGVP